MAPLTLTSSTSTRTTSCKIHPLVLFSILDAYTRRSEGQERVIGTLLGRSVDVSDKNDVTVEITNSFAVPHMEKEEDSNCTVAVGKDYQRQMVALHTKVNKNEKVVGWYATTMSSSGQMIVESSSLIHDFYADECEDPIHLVIDASLLTNKICIKAFINTSLAVQGVSFANMFHEIKLTMIASDCEKIAIDKMVLDNSQTVPDIIESGDENNTTNIEQSMKRLHDLLETTSTYLNSVITGATPASNSIGRTISGTIAQLPKVDAATFDKLYNDNMQDLLMVMYLGKLTKTQLNIAEKITATLTI